MHLTRAWLCVPLLLALLLVACDTGGGSTTAPSAPTNVTVTPDPGAITVSWEHDGTNATGFAIYREAVTPATTTAAAPLAVVDVAVRLFRDESVEAGVSYAYSVAALGAGGRASHPTPHDGAPVAPGEPTLELFAYVGTHVGQRPEPDTFLGYRIRLLRDPDLDVGTNITLTVTGPGAWGTHERVWTEAPTWRGAMYYSLQLRDAVSGAYEVTATIDGESASNTITVDADIVLPRPTGETVVRSTVDQLALSWDPVPGAAHYSVLLSRAEVGLFHHVHTANPEADFSSLDLDPTARHRVRLTAYSTSLRWEVWGDEPPPPQQVNRADIDRCFFPGDEAFSDCE